MKKLDVVIRLWLIAIIVFMFTMLGRAQNQTSTGIIGPRGYTGARGPSGNIAVRNVYTGVPGSSVIVTNVGTLDSALLDITIPRGSAFYNGGGVPSSGLGLAGDYYIDTTAGCLYGPKAVGWPGSCTPFAGSVGPQGPAGTPGATGPIGADANPIANSVQRAGSIAAAYTATMQAAVVESAVGPNNQLMGADIWNRYGQQDVTAGSTLYDYRGGVQTTFSKDVYFNFSGGQRSPAVSFNQNNSHRDPNFAVGNPASSSIGLSTVQVVATPGSYAYGMETGSSMVNFSGYVASMGLNQGYSSDWTKTGIGDTDWEYVYFHYVAGGWNGDDEGTSGKSFQMLQLGIVPVATIASVDSSTNSMRLTNVVESGHLGNGRFLVQTKHSNGSDAAVLTGTVTSFSGTEMIGTWSTPPAISITGVISGGIATPNNLDVPQSMSVTITGITGGTLSAGSNKYFCLKSNNRFERVNVTSVGALSGGSQTANILVRNQFIGVTAVYQDSGAGLGLCGTIASFDFSKMNNGNGTNGAPYVRFPLVGAIVGGDSTTHIIYAMPLGNGEANPLAETAYLMPSIYTNQGFIRLNNTAYVHLSGPELIGTSVTVTGTTDFNGTYTLLPAHFPMNGFYNAKFALSGADIVTQQIGTISGNAGRNGIHVYKGAMVTNVVDSDITDATLGNYVQTEKTDIAWEVGGYVEEPLWYNAPARAEFLVQQCWTLGCEGHEWNESGTGVSAGYHALRIGNGNPITMYQGYGGQLALGQRAIEFAGVWNTYLATIAIDGQGQPVGPATGYTFANLGCTQSLDGTTADCSYGSGYNVLLFGTSYANGIVLSYNSMYVNTADNSLNIDMKNLGYKFGTTKWGLGEFQNATTGYSTYRLWTDNSIDFNVHIGDATLGSNQGLDIEQGNLRVKQGYAEFYRPYGGSLTGGVIFDTDGGAKIGLQICNPNLGIKMMCGGNSDGTGFSVPNISDGIWEWGRTISDLGTNSNTVASGLPYTYKMPVSAVFTGVLGANPNAVTYVLASVAPDNTLGGIPDWGSNGAQVFIPAIGLDSSNYVTITCPTSIQPNHPSGTTYKLYMHGNGTPNSIVYVGNCPIGGTIVDNSIHPAFVAPINMNAPMYAGQYIVSPSGGFGFANNNFNMGYYGWITSNTSGRFNFGVTEGATDGNLYAATFNGALVGAAPAGTLSGSTLAAGVTASSLTSAAGGSFTPLAFHAVGSTASGTTCTITAVDNGVVTGVTCTP